MACKLCNGTKHLYKEGLGWVRCQCWYDARARRIMGAGGFPIPLLDIESKSFSYTTPSRKRLGAAIKDEIANYGKAPFFIYSQSQEKEKAAAIITRYLLKKYPDIETCQFIKLDEVIEHHFNKDSEEISLAEPESVDILALVLGDEITNKAHKNILYNLLYDRALHERFTLLLSFIPRELVKTRYDERLGNFLEQNFKFFEC